MLLCALLAAPSPHLVEGIRLYKAQNYSEALSALTHAIDEPNSSHDKARIHVYIGLIQFRFSMTNDASASFEQALDYDASLKLPKKGTHPNARKLFAKIKRDRFGDERSTIKKKVRRSKRSNGDEPPGEAKLDPEPDPVADPPLSPPPPPPPPIATAPPPPAAEVAPPPSIAPPPPPPPALTPPVTVTTTPEEGSNLALPAWISIGAGGAAAIVAIALGSVSIYNFATDQDEPFAADVEAKYQAAVKQRTGAIIAGSIGAVGLSVGTALFLIE